MLHRNTTEDNENTVLNNKCTLFTTTGYCNFYRFTKINIFNIFKHAN